MKNEKRYTINSDKIAWRIVDGEAVILNLDTGSYYSLDKIGTEVWQLLSEGKSLEDAINMIGNEYEAEEPRIKDDLLGLIGEFEREGLIDERL